MSVLAIMTEWALFRTPSFDVMAKLMNGKNIFDGRNLYELDYVQKSGFYY